MREYHLPPPPVPLPTLTNTTQNTGRSKQIEFLGGLPSMAYYMLRCESAKASMSLGRMKFMSNGVATFAPLSVFCRCIFAGVG